MRSGLLSRLSPAVGQQLFQFAGLHGIDPGQDIGEVFDGVDVVGFARSHEREVDRGGTAAGIRANEEAVFPHQYKIFHRLLGDVVVDVEVGILEESRQSDPVIESVFTGGHEGMRRIEFRFQGNNLFAQFLYQRFRTSASSRQPLSRCFPFYVPFHVVELFIYIQDYLAEFRFDDQAIEVSSARVSVAADFGPRLIFEEGVKAASSVCLDAGGNVLEPSLVSFEGLIGREIEHSELEFSRDVDGHFAFAHSSFEFAVLDLDLRVIGIDDRRLADFACHQIVKQFESECGIKRAVALSRTRDGDLFALETFLLAVMRQAVAESAGDDVGAQRCCVLTVCMVRLFGSDDVDFALLARPYLLLMLQVSNRVQQFVELIAQFITDEGGGDLAFWADRIYFRHEVIDGVGWNVVVTDVLSRDVIFGWLRFRGSRGIFSWCSLRVVAFSFRTEILAVALFELNDEDVELFLKVFELLPEIFLPSEGLAQLLAEFCTAAVGFFELRFKRLKESLLLGIFSSEAIEFGVV